MGRIFLPLSIIAIVLVLATGGGVYWTAKANIAGAKQEAASAVAQGIALGIAARIDQLNRALTKMAQVPEVIEVLEQGDQLKIQVMSSRLEQYLPGAQVIRLLRPEVNEPDTQRVPHMGFADLDMVRETFTQNPMPAIQGDAGPNRHLAMTVRVVADNRVIGIILASLSYDFIKDSLQSVKLNGQFVQLKQAELELAAAGDQNLKGQADQVDIKIANTAWNVRGWYTGSASVSEFGLVAGIMTVSSLLICLTFFVGYRKTSDTLSLDLSSVMKAAKDLMTGNAHGNYPVYFSEMSLVISSLVQFKRVLEQKEGAMGTDQAENNDFDGFFEESDFAIEELAHDSAQEGDEAIVASPAPMPSPEPPAEKKVAAAATAPSKVDSATEIFRAYDIRGIVGKTLTQDIVYDIARAFGTEAKELDCKTVVIGRDGRNSSAGLADALARGLISTGRDVLDLGMVPTPVLYFVAHHTPGRTGVMITGSHNPADYNGLKMVLKGETLAGPKISRLKACIDKQAFAVEVEGKIDQNSMFVNEYIGIIAEDVHMVRPMKVVIDCGNGVAGDLAPVLFRTLGCEVVELFCDVDGNFPHHHPDPSKPENLSELVASVKQHQADIGIAFDGDGDRLGIVDSSGKIIWPDRQMMLFARDVLSRKPGAEIIYDVKCSRHLPQEIAKFGGRPLMWKTGHSFMKAKLKETGAKLAGEMSGHIFFNDRWFGFDDGLYSAARMIEILSSDTRTSAEVFASLPDSVNTPELNIEMAEGENFLFIEKLIAKADFKEGKITDIDGLRVDFSDGWGLVRASNTTPSLVIRFEADDESALRRIQSEFKSLMKQIKPDIALPF
ncbi:MAG: phosphomannomutase/phosphoglucomutase [Gammaproteobacteria bacterium]